MAARILIINDSDNCLLTITEHLIQDYYLVTSVNSINEAVNAIKTVEPDVILISDFYDNHAEFSKLKSSIHAYIPIVFISSKDGIINVDVDDCLTWPIESDIFRIRMRSLVRLKRVYEEWLLRNETSSRISGSETSRFEINNNGGKILAFFLAPNDLQFLQTTLELNNHKILEAGSLSSSSILQLFDLFILNLNDPRALWTCSRLHADKATRHVPILLVYNKESIKRVPKALDIGANDYLKLPCSQSELLLRVKLQIKRKRFHDKMVTSFSQNIELATIDSLTELYNRSYLTSHIQTMLEKAQVITAPISLCFIDIDNFKNINDKYGHSVGDAVLKHFAQCLRECGRANDLLGRYGGDEFILAMFDTHQDQAVIAAERIRDHVEQTPIPTGINLPSTIFVTLSIGVYSNNNSIDDLLINADQAMYIAKNSGGNKVFSKEKLKAALV